MVKKLSGILLIIFSIVFALTGCGGTTEPVVSNTNEPNADATQTVSTDSTVDTTGSDTGLSVDTQEPEPVVEPATDIAEDDPADTETEVPETTEPSVSAPQFVAGSPVSVFTDADIDYLGIDVSGTDRQIAEAIKTWQENNMIYASPQSGYIDASDPIRWNYFLPGIWPSRDIIYDHMENGKIYGICEDYATIYSSIANYYGLETRVVNTLSKPSDSAAAPALPGMAMDEYTRNKPQLLKYGLNYSYDAVSSVAEETPTHYWAEVYLDGEWVVMDASQKSTGGNTSNEFIVTGDYEVTDWMARDMTAELAKFVSTSPTDDLGQTGRAGSIGEIMQGFALAPYFNEAEDAVAFIGAEAYMTAADIREMNMDKTEYEACSGEHLYLVSYLICDGDGLSGQAWLDRYYETSGEQLNLQCAADIISGD